MIRNYFRGILAVTSRLQGLQLGSQSVLEPISCHIKQNFAGVQLPAVAQFHSSSIKCGLEEFFDKAENWNLSEIKVGRGWKIDELRIKSNEDLHKLWYVLLKEKNMLLTMETLSKKERKLFPNPERIDKVQESMDNLEEVVKERDRAYWLLEVGENGQRPRGEVLDTFGRNLTRRYSEHRFPEHLHTRFQRRPALCQAHRTHFNRLLREQFLTKRRREKNRILNHVSRLCQRFPDINMENLQAKFPTINVYMVKGLKRSRGNHPHNWT